MTIKKILIFSSCLLGIVIVTLIISLIIVNKSERLIRETQQMSNMSMMLAEELRESSRGLTAAVEKFTVTADERYANAYMDIINIRAGKKLRPDDNRKIAPRQLITLNELMKQANFTEQELELLQQAESLSDKLTIRELQAMNAVRGLFPDDAGNYTITGAPDMQLAKKLIFSSEYEEEVARIMQPINLFNKLLNERLNSAINAAQSDFNHSMRVMWIILAVLICMLIAFFSIVSFVIIRPILLCDIFARQIAAGTFDSGLNYASNNEIGSLAASLRSMVQSLLERMRFKEHSRYFDAVIASADAGVVITDKNYKITDWNTGAERILGYTASEIIGKTAKVYTPESSHSSLDSLHERLQKGEHIPHLDAVRKHKDGRMVDCSASYTPIFDSDGIFTGFLGVFHDITAAKLAEQKARNLAAIVAIADAGIIVKNKEGAVIEWNIGAESILGYKPEEIIGQTTHYYAPESSHGEIDDTEARLKCGERIMRLDVMRKHKNGRFVDCSSSYTPIFDKQNEFAGSIAVFHDISDKKRLEFELKAAIAIAEEKHQTIMSSIIYASKIQKNLLPKKAVFEQGFSDYSVIWKPRDIVGGDIYWLKCFEDGALLCVCDCTGHGIPGALLTMLIASAFDTAVNETNYKDTGQIIYMIDRQLSTVLNANATDDKISNNIKDGCDIAVLYIAKDGTVTISSANIRVFICDGKEVTQLKGQKLFIGEGCVKSKDDVKVITIPANPDNKFYIATDGIYDQFGGKPPRPFGYKRFTQMILENHHENQAAISSKIWGELELYRGTQERLDDAQLITFKP